jgi:hypothetical protein
MENEQATVQEWNEKQRSQDDGAEVGEEEEEEAEEEEEEAVATGLECFGSKLNCWVS